MNPLLVVVAKKRASLGGGGAVAPYYRSLTVDHTKVPTSLSNFPVLVSLTHATLKTVANGGHVERSDGFDIGFYTDTARTTPLKWEMDTYDGATGTVVAWVKMAFLSSATDTVFYISYGDPAITTDQSDPVNVWTASFLGVYHMGNGTTLSVADSTTANNGTNHGATAVTGKIGGGGGFVAASTQYVDLGNSMNPAALTHSAWIKATSYPGGFNSVIIRNNGAGSITGSWVNNSGGFAPFFTTTGGTAGSPGSHTLVTGTWYHMVAAYDSVAGFTSYINGASDFIGAATGTLLLSATSTYIGKDQTTSGTEWNGSIDEVRLASVARSADWITAEYNNQNSPGTFMALGTEVGS